MKTLKILPEIPKTKIWLSQSRDQEGASQQTAATGGQHAKGCFWKEAQSINYKKNSSIFFSVQILFQFNCQLHPIKKKISINFYRIQEDVH